MLKFQWLCLLWPLSPFNASSIFSSYLRVLVWYFVMWHPRETVQRKKGVSGLIVSVTGWLATAFGAWQEATHHSQVCAGLKSSSHHGGQDSERQTWVRSQQDGKIEAPGVWHLPYWLFLSNPSFIYPYLQRFLDRALLTRPLPKACLELLHREPIPPEKVTLGEFHIPGIRTITQGWSDCPCGFPPKPSSLESPAS